MHEGVDSGSGVASPVGVGSEKIFGIFLLEMVHFGAFHAYF